MENSYKVVLESVGSKMSALQALVKIPGVTENDAMRILSSVPSVVKEDISSKEADFIVELLVEAGCKASSVASVETEDVSDEMEISEGEASYINPDAAGMAAAYYVKSGKCFDTAGNMFWISIGAIVLGLFVHQLLAIGFGLLIVGLVYYFLGRSNKKKGDALKR